MPPIFADHRLAMMAPVPYNAGSDYRYGDLRVIIYGAAFRRQLEDKTLTAEEVIEAVREMMQRPQLVKINGCPC